MAWTAHLDDADRALMVTELRACLVTLEHSGDPVPLETCLRDWRSAAITCRNSAANPVPANC